MVKLVSIMVRLRWVLLCGIIQYKRFNNVMLVQAYVYLASKPIAIIILTSRSKMNKSQVVKR